MNNNYNPGTAAVLAFIFPGAGHFYSGRILRGFLWCGSIWLGYLCLFFPGALLHIISIVAAHDYIPPQYRQDNNS